MQQTVALEISESSSFHPEIHVRKVQNHIRNENIPSGLGFVEISKRIHRISEENGGVSAALAIFVSILAHFEGSIATSEY